MTRALIALNAPIAARPPCGQPASPEWNAVCRSFAALRLDPCAALVQRVAGKFADWLKAAGIEDAGSRRRMMRAADRRLCERFLRNDGEVR